MEGIPERGSLDEVPLARLLLQLHAARANATLVLRHQKVTRRISLSEGYPVSLSSTRPGDALLERLRRAERLAEADCERVRQHMERRRSTDAAALLQLGILSPREILAALRAQLRAALVDCFAWAAGEFALEAAGELPREAQALRSDPLAIVREGIEAHWGAERIFSELAPRLARYPTRAEGRHPALTWAERDPRAAAILEQLDGSRTLDQVLREAGDPGALALVWVLDVSGALCFADAARSEAGEPSETEVDEREPEVEELEIVIESARDARAAGGGPRSEPRGRERPGRDAARAEALRNEVEEKHAQLGELDHYALLGLERDASAAEVKRAYFAAAKRFHPDVLSRLGLQELRSKAEAVFAEIAKAYELLSDEEKRRRYDASLGGEDAQDGTRLVQAETLYRKGEILLRAGNFRGALEFLRPAVELWPMDALYQASLGWALYRKRPSEPEAARELLERAVSLDPMLAQAHAWLAAVRKELGDAEGAARSLARARELDPAQR